MVDYIHLKKTIFVVIIAVLLISYCNSETLRYLQDDVEEDISDTSDIYSDEDKFEPGPVSTTFFETASDVVQLEWCGVNYDIVLALTQDGKIYRSSNRGKDWEYQSIKYVNKGQSPLANVIRMVFSPVDVNIVFFIGGKGINWVTTD